MPMYFLILGVFGVWRVTHLLSQEAGPLEIFSKLRRLAGEGFWGQLFSCFYCMSVWVSAPFAILLAQSWKERTLLWLAFSGAAILLERISGDRSPAKHGFYIEEMESEHVLR
jgi:hypothetical protein